jgi:type II secretion system protein H
MRPASTRQQIARGFSLVELMIVLVVIGIVTAVMVGELRGTFEGALLRSTSRKLLAVVSLASSQSVALNREHRLRIEPQTGHYFLERTQHDSSSEGGQSQVRDLPDGEGDLDTRIKVQIRESAAQEISEEGEAEPLEPQDTTRIAFHPDGTAEAREILLEDRAGFRMALRVDPATSRVHIVELGRP